MEECSADALDGSCIAALEVEQLPASRETKRAPKYRNYVKKWPDVGAVQPIVLLPTGLLQLMSPLLQGKSFLAGWMLSLHTKEWVALFENPPGAKASSWRRTLLGLARARGVIIKFVKDRVVSFQARLKRSPQRSAARPIAGTTLYLSLKSLISPKPRAPTDRGVCSSGVVTKQLEERSSPKDWNESGPKEGSSVSTPNSADGHSEIEHRPSQTTESVHVQPQVQERNSSTDSSDGHIPDNSVGHSQEEPSSDSPTRVTIAFSLATSTFDPQHLPPTCNTSNAGNTSCASDAVPCAETSSPTQEACTPRPMRLFPKFPIVAFGYQPEVLREYLRVLTSYFSADLPYDQILASLASTQPLEVAFSQELDNLQMMFANPKAIHRRQVSVTLLIEFSKSVEHHALQMSAPIMDSPIMGPLPFLNELVQALSDKSMSVFQIEFPSAISEDKVGAALLLLAKVLTESVIDSGLLTSLECEEQSVVLVGNCVCLSSDNHALEALLKIFPNQATGFCVVATPSQKQSVDVVETFLNDIPRRLRSKFASQSCRLVEIFRQLSPAVVAAEEDSGAVTSGPYITPSPFSVPAASIPRVEMEPSNTAGSSEDTQVAQPCEETGCGKHYYTSRA